MLICSIAGCNQPVKARGLCGTHYERQRVGRQVGTPIWRRIQSPVERYVLAIDRSDPNGCWPWIRGCNGPGYGYFVDGGKHFGATRWGYEHLIGPIPTGLDVCHRCDNPPCQRPDHWFLGSRQDNLRDMVAKGRQPNVNGERNPQAKLTEAQVLQIRERHATEAVTQRQLADDFGVSFQTISTIVRGEHWRHL